jgi:TctA family transporter
MINSHFAYVLEKNFFSKKSNALSAMKRIASSESSNNAGQVTDLIPLFILGLAAQPSEVVLLDLIMNKQWTIANTLNLDFIWSL